MAFPQPAQPLFYPTQHIPARQRSKGSSSLRRRFNNFQKQVFLETVIKLIISSIGLCLALSALSIILSYYQRQQNRLQQVETELKATEEKMETLQENFQQYFDPQQARTIMQEQTYWADPSQLRVVWLPSTPSKTDLKPNIAIEIKHP
ncbi:MAG: hypothetical protein ACKO3I_04100 [Synechococcales cyanobacterium]